MNLKPILFGLLVITAALRAAAPPDVKWHPGHYVFLGTSKLTSEVLTLPHFRGVQKVYTWRDFEPELGRYDFSTLKADLALAKKHGRQLVVQFSFKSFAKGLRNVPDYLTGAEYGGGVYVTTKGSLNPVIWNRNVAARFDAVLTALGREFDRDPNLEAVNLPETATSAQFEKFPQANIEPYTEQGYFAALKQQMATLRRVFPNTVVIQYLNFPPNLLGALTDYAKEIGVGMGGPDVYPRESPLSDPQTGIYRLYGKLAGTVPMGAAVQVENYSIALKKRSGWGRVHLGEAKPGDEIPFPVRDHLRLAQQTLKLNYLFWSANPANCLDNVKKLLAEPDLAGDPAGGLESRLPPKAFLR
jgi:hypothetical protein